jgi:ribonuclease VapC
MMAVDTSAILAIALEEEEIFIFTEILSRNKSVIGASTLLEAHIVLTSRLGTEGPRFLSKILSEARISVIAFTEEHSRIAQEAFTRYGKGQGHRAQLNFGDCLSYAVAKAENLPLLFKGADFSYTDIEAAI